MENKLLASKKASENKDPQQRFAKHEVKNSNGVFDYDKCKRATKLRMTRDEALEMIADHKQMLEFTIENNNGVDLEEYYREEIEELEKII